ncbi:DUF4214 domain-containing protein [Methylobacterium sp. HMF5984]|uniref:DUF4214 domain-containing protein n=1 Tax=Methylobacterium sp. HMF5984 TaxID=3367370 RepID=UPI003853C3FD
MLNLTFVGSLDATDIARAFLASDEYKVHTTGLTDANYVDMLYSQTLGRAGDVTGLLAWNSNLAHGMDRAKVINGFTDSFEFQSKYLGASNATYVEGLYEHALGRTGESNGLAAWSQLLNNHALSRADIAHAFSGSAEFQQKYVAPSDASYVDDLYIDALGRHAEAAGLQIWTTALTHGSTRADVAVAITQSAEAQAHIVGSVDQGWHIT